jgi:hypothetical protein
MGERTYPNPNDPLDPTPPSLHHSLDIPTTLRRLLRHAALDQLALFVCGDLAGHEDLREMACAGSDGLGIGSGG